MNKEKKALEPCFCINIPRHGCCFCEKDVTTSVTSKSLWGKKKMHNKQKNIKSCPLSAQISALSEEIEKLFNIICKFGPLIGLMPYKFGLFWSFCTTFPKDGKSSTTEVPG